MRILVVADEESKSLWDYYKPGKLQGLDLIISCGDLNPHYLQFLVTLSGCPLLYVRGNHDSRYDSDPPDGCICIEDKIYNHRGLRIAGLGGCMRYRNGPDMYTEKEMKTRVRLISRKIFFTNGIDLLVTHAPARGYGDMEDLPHRGFSCFNELLMKNRPLYHLHGHVHKSYTSKFQRKTDHPSGTVIVNAYESYVLEIPEMTYPEYGSTGASIYDFQCRLAAQYSLFSRNPI